MPYRPCQAVLWYRCRRPYRFETGAGGNTGNTEWALVTYGNDYTISVR